MKSKALLHYCLVIIVAYSQITLGMNPPSDPKQPARTDRSGRPIQPPRQSPLSKLSPAAKEKIIANARSKEAHTPPKPHPNEKLYTNNPDKMPLLPKDTVVDTSSWDDSKYTWNTSTHTWESSNKEEKQAYTWEQKETEETEKVIQLWSDISPEFKEYYKENPKDILEFIAERPLLRAIIESKVKSSAKKINETRQKDKKEYLTDAPIIGTFYKRYQYTQNTQKAIKQQKQLQDQNNGSIDQTSNELDTSKTTPDEKSKHDTSEKLTKEEFAQYVHPLYSIVCPAAGTISGVLLTTLGATAAPFIAPVVGIAIASVGTVYLIDGLVNHAKKPHNDHKKQPHKHKKRHHHHKTTQTTHGRHSKAQTITKCVDAVLPQEKQAGCGDTNPKSDPIAKGCGSTTPVAEPQSPGFDITPPQDPVVCKFPGDPIQSPTHFEQTKTDAASAVEKKLPGLKNFDKQSEKLKQLIADTDFHGALTIVQKYTSPNSIEEIQTPKGLVVVHYYDDGKIIVREHSAGKEHEGIKGLPTIEIQTFNKNDPVTKIRLDGIKNTPEVEL